METVILYAQIVVEEELYLYNRNDRKFWSLFPNDLQEITVIIHRGLQETVPRALDSVDLVDSREKRGD
ncbi:6667_t:CDS:2, partial [Paraglomus occultum]